jgi:phenylalanyl-tRNA synthetase alpha chain
MLTTRFSGKKGDLARLKTKLGSLDTVDEKKAAGQAINEAMTAVSAALGERRSLLASHALAEQIETERLDLTEFVGRPARGHAHLVTQAWERLEDVFIGLGFRVAEGPEVETDWHNFEALNMSEGHPARGEFDTLFVDHVPPDGRVGTTLLRTHTSPVQIRAMLESEPPIYIVAPGRVFRRDTPDATHMPVFHQIEGLVVDRNITMADLAGTIEAFTKAFFGPGFTSRLRPSYFPFTEPSAEFDIQRPNGDWIELGGCGMVHPNVLRAGGLDPEEWSGFAFGFGIDRMAKERHGVDDIREMYTNDIRFLEQF